MAFGSLAYAVPDWTYRIADEVDTAGLTLELDGLAKERLSLSASYVHSDGGGRYDTEWAGGLSAFPELVSQHRALDLRARYRLGNRHALVVRYYRER